MKRLTRIFIAAVAVLAAAAACTPSGSTGFLPATHSARPLDSGGGLPPHPSPGAIATPTP